MLRVLVISYYWPPAGGPGVQRVLKFVKYLPLFGIEPIVLTVEEGDFPTIDESLIEEIPNSVPVYQTKVWEPYYLFRLLTGRSKYERIPIAFLGGSQSRTVQDRLSSWIRRNIFIPDARIGWYPYAAKKAKQIVSYRNIDLVFSSGPPHSLHLIAKRIKKKHNIPWVADFRDPWTDLFYYQGQKRLNLVKKLDLWFEQSVLSTADQIITVSPGVKFLLEKKVKKPIDVIYNGYDEEDFQDIPKADYTSERQITYIGNMASSQIPFSLFTALKQVVNGSETSYRLQFIGNVHNQVYEEITNHSLDDITSFLGYVSHQKAIEAMLHSAFLLLVIPDTEENLGIVTGKLFEYLRARVPIILLGPPECDAAHIIGETRSGFVFHYDDINGLTKLLQSKPRIEPVGIEKYKRKSITHQLAGLFESVVSSHTV